MPIQPDFQFLGHLLTRFDLPDDVDAASATAAGGVLFTAL
jgi:hypothetical protein